MRRRTPYLELVAAAQRREEQARLEGVSVDLLRAYLEKSGLSKSEVCRRLGWFVPDVNRLNRALGYRAAAGGRDHGRKYRQRRVSYRMAVRLCEAMGADPIDVGL